jgi:hypothetical protein
LDKSGGRIDEKIFTTQFSTTDEGVALGSSEWDVAAGVDEESGAGNCRLSASGVEDGVGSGFCALKGNARAAVPQRTSMISLVNLEFI